MLIRTWSRVRSQAVCALALIVGVPAVAHAQQTGLFPLHPIRRERVPCPAEDPVYRLHREQYYGYFPTCWRRFPPGWGCLSPEAPNADASFRAIPRSNPPAQYGEEPDESAAPDQGDRGPRPRGAAPADTPTPLPAPPPGGRNLFDLENPKPANPPAPNPPDIKQPAAPENPNNPTNRSTPSSKPSAAGAQAIAPEVGLAPREASPGAAGPIEPLLALPEPPAAAAPPSPAVNPVPSADAAAGAMSDPGPQPTAQPEQAPQRRSLLGSLFGNLRRR